MSNWFSPEAARDWIGLDWFDETVIIQGAGSPPATGPGLIKVWNSSAWVEKPVKVWTGSAWVQKPLKYWTGTEWRATGSSSGPVPIDWYTPSAPYQLTPNSSPFQYYEASLAWSWKFSTGTMNYPRPTNRMFISEGGFMDVQGDNDGGGSNGFNFISNITSWGYDSQFLTQHILGSFTPEDTHNFVMLWSQSGSLSGGNRAQLWHNGDLISSTSYAIADFALYNLRLFGDGATVLPGQTQGYWWRSGAVINPATAYSTLFDGANGMLDLTDPAIGGVSPTSYQFGA